MLKRSARNKNCLYILLLLIVVGAVFIRTLHFGFVWLDHSQIESKTCIIKNFNDLKSAFKNPLLHVRGKGSYYRPFFKISYTLDSLIFKENAFGFHLSNLLLHIFNLFIIYFILLRFKISQSTALMLSLLFGILPLNTSTVVLIGARADLLAGFFIFLAFLLGLFYMGKKRAIYLFSSLLMYVLALLSKEIALPFFLVILLMLFLKKEKVSSLWVFPGAAFFYILLRIYTLGHIGSKEAILRGDACRTLLSSGVAFLNYIFKFFIPINLSVSDAFLKYSSIFDFPVFVSFIVLFSFFSFFLYFVLRKDFMPALSLGWVIIFYLPISNVIPALHFWAERFFYLSGFGLILLLAYLIKVRPVLKKILLILVPIYIICNLNYQKYFKNDISLFNRALKVSEYSQEAHTMLGYKYLLGNEPEKSIYHYLLSIRGNDNYYSFASLKESYNNLGVLFLRLKNYEEARKWFFKVLDEDPLSEITALNLSILESENK